MTQLIQLRTDLLTNSYRYFARNVLKIKTDEGLIDFTFNQVQDYIDYRANQQLKRTQKIRLIIVKARQQGSSEYVSGRGYKYATQNNAKTVYILSHESASTAKLFAKVDRYYRYAPPSTKPLEVASNRNQKKWANESEYTVGTAGSENTGRSDTVQFAHISEPAHYADDEGIKSGLLQTVSDKPYTEVWWESTANGMNWFHQFVMQYLDGTGEYEVIFIPWFWSDKYAVPAKSHFQRTEEESLLAQTGTYFDRQTKQIILRPLTDNQLQWRRNKIAELGERLFKQEYPATLTEAFQASGDSFIPSDLIERARKSILEETYGANILGVDPARRNDRFAIVHRKGRQVIKTWTYDCTKEEMTDGRSANIIKEIIIDNEIERCFIDEANGYNLIDRLKDDGFQHIVRGVSFSESPDDTMYLNKRAEMFFRVRDYFRDDNPRIPDQDDLATDIAAIPDAMPTDTGRWKFPTKKEILQSYGKSPDLFDALALTFAERVIPKDAQPVQTQYTQNSKQGFSELQTAARIRMGDNETSQPLREKREFKRDKAFQGY